VLYAGSMQRRAIGFLFCLAVAPGLVAQEAREILASRCLVCHGATRMGDVDLRTLRSGDPLLEKWRTW
jgi:mono/diheme cytochrome c family protein